MEWEVRRQALEGSDQAGLLTAAAVTSEPESTAELVVVKLVAWTLTAETHSSSSVSSQSKLQVFTHNMYVL